MAGTQEFEYESVQTRESVQEFLKSLVEGFENSRISLKSDQEEILLTPQELLNFSIKAKRKGLKNKLSFKIEWKEPEANKKQGTISIESE